MTQPDYDGDVSIRLDEATRERINKISIERKKSVNSRQSKADRKSAIFSAADKWTNPFEKEDAIRPTKHPPKKINSMPVKKRKPRASDELSASEHTGRSYDRVVKPGEDDGKLGDLLGKMNDSKPAKRRGDSRTVASMPVTSSRDSPRRRMSGDRSSRSSRLKSPGPLKHPPSSSSMKRRTASPGPMKKRSSSPGPHSERRRSSSVGPLKKNAEPSSPSKSPLSSPQRTSSPERRSSSTRGRKKNSEGGGLDGFLGEKEKSKRSSGGSVASAPALRRKDSRRARRSSRGPLSTRRARSADVDEPLVEENEVESPKRRRARSVDDVDLGIGEEDLKDESSSPAAPKNFSQRLSKRLNSFRKLAGLGGSQKTMTTQGDSSSTEEGEQTSKRNTRATRRESVRSKEKPNRSSSAGPLSRPGRKDREDRRAGLSKSKRNTAAQAQPDGGDDDDNECMKPPQRAQSMMLHREATRRGKSASLMDLQQYSEEEIHSTSYFASNHVLVNRDRMKRGLRPLTRNIAMDQIARENAEKMSKATNSTPLPATYVGNVLKGESIRAIHRAIMQNKEGRERANVLSPYFQDFGIGTAKGEDGKLYICQLFSERLELTITDTTSST